MPAIGTRIDFTSQTFQKKIRKQMIQGSRLFPSHATSTFSLCVEVMAKTARLGCRQALLIYQDVKSDMTASYRLAVVGNPFVISKGITQLFIALP